MRILFLSAEHARQLGTGGIGSYVATISRALAQRGHDVHVLSCLPNATCSDSVGPDGVKMHVRRRLRLPELRGRGRYTRERLALAFSNYWHGSKLGRFDIIEAPDWRAEGLLFAISGKPVVTHLHTPHIVLEEYNRYPRNRDTVVADFLERVATIRSRAITSPSRLLVQELRGRNWLKDRAVETIRYPVDHARGAGVVSAAMSAPVVLIVGRIERRKAPEDAVTALALLKQEGVGARLVLVGRGSGSRDGIDYDVWVRALAEAKGVECQFAGELPWQDLFRVYGESRVVCVPSRFESFSMAAVEGMAAGRPVVLTERVGAGELLGEDHEEQVRLGRPADLAAGLRRFLVDAGEAARVGASNRRLAIQLCDPATVAEQREMLYSRVAASRARFKVQTAVRDINS